MHLNNLKKSTYIIIKMKSVGFIMLRHVNNELTNQYWIHSYHCIRKHYPENKILIIDDSSDYNFLTDYPLYKTTVINSTYPKRGELLPYYYYLQTKLFDIAVIIHDSVFINKYINFNNVNACKMIWDFQHHWDQIEDETNMINLFSNKELLNFYENKHLWVGCFGGMSVISHNYLSAINRKYDISKLLGHVLNKYNRCSFERVIACLLQINETTNEINQSLLGNIHKYCKWNVKFHEINEYEHLPIIKVWTGR